VGTQHKGSKARARPSPRGRPRKYSEEVLVAAALRLMGRDGYKALTVRTLADELGISHSALYTYVDAIDEIEQKAVHQLTDQLPVPSAQSPSELRRQLIAFLHAARKLLKLHPGIVMSRIGSVSSEIFRDISEQWFRALSPFAPDRKTLELALTALMGVVLLVVEGERLLEAGTDSKVRRTSGKKRPAEGVPMQVVDQYLDDLIGLVLPGLTATANARNPRSRSRTS
jgi:AcrR family transcriptional regulator